MCSSSRSDLLFLPECLSLSYLLFMSFFFCHTLTPNLFSICLTGFLQRVHPYAILSNCRSSHFVSFCVIFASFSQHVSPFLCYNQTLSRFPQIPSATPAFSPSFSICLSPCLFFSASPLPLPPSLFCSPAAHKNSSFLSPEDCSVAQGFTAFLYVFSPSSLHICLPLFLSLLAALHSV